MLGTSRRWVGTVGRTRPDCGIRDKFELEPLGLGPGARE
jgi:hypothetical protein